MKKLVILLSMFFLVASVSAVPTINSVGGNFSEEQIVTISGSEFGAEGPVVYKWDNFNQIGGAFEVGEIIANGWTHYAYSQYFKPVYSETNSRYTGSKHARMYWNITDSSNYYIDSTMYYDGGTTPKPKVYVTYYYRRENLSPGHITDNNKLSRVTYDARDGTGDNPVIAVTRVGYTEDSGIYHVAKTCGDSETESNSHGAVFQNGYWQRYEGYYIQGGLGIPNGTALAWIQSPGGEFNQILNRSGNYTTRRADCDREWYDYMIGGYLRPGHLVDGVVQVDYEVEYESYYDDFYFADSRARIELGNNANFSLCTHREIQIPQTWSDGSITFNVNQGSFSEGETAYVFVVDENGTASEGYPINIFGEIILPEYNETCGNSYCNATAGENCTTCSQDCGNCTTTYPEPHIQDYITLQEMIGSIEDYKRGLTPIEQVVANIKKFIWG